ncbi:MAG: hypothetical protein F4047_15550 [Caldilineaceae bacterium SB0670_bin_27]|nr:hypothetical protein [Caldilineaceae bacterium SB0670_bin_27]
MRQRPFIALHPYRGTLFIVAFLVALALLTAATKVHATESDTPDGDADRAALTALFNATDGENWVNNQNWLTDKPLSTWYGVTTNGNGRVTQLILRGNRLSGEIPPQLGSLTQLERLVIDDNLLVGLIPPELGNLTQLQWLDLDRNQLNGEIPPDLGKLLLLERLDLSGNQLSGSIPPEIGGLTELRTLYFDENQLS